MVIMVLILIVNIKKMFYSNENLLKKKNLSLLKDIINKSCF